jgi:hypothetical protein
MIQWRCHTDDLAILLVNRESAAYGTIGTDGIRLSLARGAARNALAAALITEEGGDPQENLLQVDAVIEKHDDAGAECSADGTRALECERRVELRRGNKNACCLLRSVRTVPGLLLLTIMCSRGDGF